MGPVEKVKGRIFFMPVLALIGQLEETIESLEEGFLLGKLDNK